MNEVIEYTESAENGDLPVIQRNGNGRSVSKAMIHSTGYGKRSSRKGAHGAARSASRALYGSSRASRNPRLRRYQKRRPRKGTIIFFALVFVLSGGLYLTTANTAGEWLADNFVLPIFFGNLVDMAAQNDGDLYVTGTSDAADADIGSDTADAASDGGDAATADALDDNTDANAQGKTASSTQSPSGTTAGRSRIEDTVTDFVSLPGLSFYAVQLGVFTSEEGALAEAERYMERGAAGYVLADEKYRVLASAYSAREQASGVAKRLNQGGMETYVFSAEVDELNMKITAKSTQVETFRAACDGFRAALDELGELTFELDQETMAEDEMILRLAKIKEDLEKLQTALSHSGKAAAGTPSLVIDGLMTLYGEFIGSLDKLTAQKEGDTLLLSTQIKYNHIDIMWRYMEYIRRLQA